MGWSVTEYVEFIRAIPPIAWAFLMPTIGICATALGAWKLGWFNVKSSASAAQDLSWDATREELDRLRKENEMLRGSLGRWREFGARVLRHFTRCACLEQAVGRELLAECVQELMGETT